MAISFGVGRRRKTLGVVADLCFACAALEPHWLCDNYATFQVHFVNVDDGMYADSSIVCCRCSRETEVKRSRYSAILPLDSAANTTLSEGLARTNESLARGLDAVSRARAGGAPSGLLEQADAVLFAKVDLGSLVAQLASWQSLNAREREAANTAMRALWSNAGSPERPTVVIQPGMPGWLTPVGKPSMARAIDYKVVLVAATIVAFIIAVVAMFD